MSPMSHIRPKFNRAALVLLMVVPAAALVLGGCEKPVFTPDEPRSQYDRFDAIRDQRAPSYVYDEFGARRPNIRQRLVTGE
ncbi:MAG: hypothetical protein NTV94_02090 [Planctomycetota bacterium]|nr:hypothetical protein [Planctomycetota bacterium]